MIFIREAFHTDNLRGEILRFHSLICRVSGFIMTSNFATFMKKTAEYVLRMFLTENCRVAQSLTFRLQISYVIKARAKQKDSHIRKHKWANGLVRFQCSVPMYIQVLKLKKVTAYEKQMLCAVLSFKRQGDSSNCRGTRYSVFTRPRSAVLLYHAQETFVKASHKVYG